MEVVEEIKAPVESRTETNKISVNVLPIEKGVIDEDIFGVLDFQATATETSNSRPELIHSLERAKSATNTNVSRFDDSSSLRSRILEILRQSSEDQVLDTHMTAGIFRPLLNMHSNLVNQNMTLNNAAISMRDDGKIKLKISM